MLLKRGWLYFVGGVLLWMVAAQSWTGQASCPSKIELAGKVSVWIDATASAGYSDAIQQPFEAVKSSFSYGSTRSAIWVKLDVSAPPACLKAPQNWLLRMNVPYHDRIDAYWQDANHQLIHWQGGDQVQGQHQQTARLPTIPLSLLSSDPLNPQTFLIRFASQNTLNVSMDLISEQAYQQHEQTMLLVSAFVGALILLALLFALLQLFIFRAKGFLFFAGFTAAISFIMMFVHGWTTVFWPARFGDAIGTLAQAFALFFLVLLSNELLKLKHYYKKLFYAQFIATSLVVGWAVVSVVMGQYRWSLPVTHLVAFFIMLGLLFTAVRLWRKEPLAKVYVLVFAVTVFALMVRIGVIQGFVPINFWTDNSMSLALTMQVLLFLLIMFIQNYQEREHRLALEAANAQLFTSATTDYLTGLLNRRYFFELAHTELERTRRYARPLACLMLDLDHFKAINDRYGHAVGDKALVAFAETLKRELRREDLVARFGGEEFVVLLPEQSLSEALTTAERLKVQIAQMELALADSESPLTITVSIGVSTLWPTDTTLDELLMRADDALYRAKAGGRNRVESE
ncbi:sensor domain-containing diguanylate cyclase [Thiomicrorhabdus cannonii]|uniref:sensor domain-containing diguanylate cyclase n=1 Tax=Thiomicrorhabdus cannonii TaxID=2748011 RepID=UPI0015BE7E76|nr:diguanylate cyclase [Thiomicrorhabdus cannonii]